MHQMVFMEEKLQSRQNPKNPKPIPKGFTIKTISIIFPTITPHWMILKTMSTPILITTAVTMATVMYV